MTRLAFRLAFAGGREGATRLLITVIAIAFGVTLLLLAFSLEPAIEQRLWRVAQRGEFVTDSGGSASNTSRDQLLIAVTGDRFAGENLTVVHTVSDGEQPPIPPGLPRLPRRGETLVSPALAELLRRPEGALLKPRFTRHISAVAVGRAALVHPDELVAWVATDPALLKAAGRARLVRDFPLEVPPWAPWQKKPALRLGVAIGVMGLLLPIAIFVGVMTRLGAAQRDRRLASLRLIGATPAQARLVAVVEAVVVGGLGSTLGVALFQVLRPAAAKVEVAGADWFPSDLAPPIVAIVAIVCAVPVVAGIGAAIAMRGVTTSPFGIARRGRRGQPRFLRALVLGIGLVGLLATNVLSDVLSPGYLVGIATLSLGSIILGLPAVGPWIASKTAAWLVERGRRAPTILAARRLEADPRGAFRSSSGVMIGVFVATVFYGYTSGNIGDVFVAELPGATSARVETYGAKPEAVTKMLRSLAHVEGVEQWAAVRRAYARGGQPVAILDCQSVNALRLAVLSPCPEASVFARGVSLSRRPEVRLYSSPAGKQGGITVTNVASGTIERLGADILGAPMVIEPSLLPREFVSELEIFDLLIKTDPSHNAIERVRNTISHALPGYAVETQETVNIKHNRALTEVQRVVNLAVLVTLLVAAASLTAATAGSVLERRRPFTLLRAMGMPVRALYETTLIEAILPLLVSVLVSAVLGIAASAAFVAAVGESYSPPGGMVVVLVVAGIFFSVLMVAATFPIISKATTPRGLRTE